MSDVKKVVINSNNNILILPFGGSRESIESTWSSYICKRMIRVTPTQRMVTICIYADEEDGKLYTINVTR